MCAEYIIIIQHIYKQKACKFSQMPMFVFHDIYKKKDKDEQDLGNWSVYIYKLYAYFLSIYITLSSIFYWYKISNISAFAVSNLA